MCRVRKDEQAKQSTRKAANNFGGIHVEDGRTTEYINFFMKKMVFLQWSLEDCHRLATWLEWTWLLKLVLSEPVPGTRSRRRPGIRWLWHEKGCPPSQELGDICTNHWGFRRPRLVPSCTVLISQLIYVDCLQAHSVSCSIMVFNFQWVYKYFFSRIITAW